MILQLFLKIYMRNLISEVILVAILAIAVAGCKGGVESLRDGDLLFQANDSSGFVDAITKSTGKDLKLSFTHVAIISKEDSGLFVVEAAPRVGVRSVPLQEFLDGSAHNAKGEPLVVVSRIADKKVAAKAVVRAKELIGNDYDFSFLPGNDAKYCSELVYECFIDDDGSHVFQMAPMTFKDSNGATTQYWIDLFAKRNEPIPEGVPGTNPNDMFADPQLKEVYRFFSAK